MLPHFRVLLSEQNHEMRFLFSRLQSIVSMYPIMILRFRAPFEGLIIPGVRYPHSLNPVIGEDY